MSQPPERSRAELEALFHRPGVQRHSARFGMPSPRNIWHATVHAFKGYELYLLDHLSDAVDAIELALRQSTGTDGLANLLYVTSAELEARDHAETIARAPFTFELPSNSPTSQDVIDLTETHAKRLERLFGFSREPTMFTLLPADSLIEMSSSPHGYFVPKAPYYKVCVVEAGPDEPPDDLSRALTHEYMHVVTGGLTDERAPRWLVEGLGEWSELELSETGELEQLALLPGERPKLDEIEGIFWSGMSVEEEPVEYAYAGAYSAVECLIEMYGMPAIREFMHRLTTEPENRAFRRALGVSRRRFEKEWHRRLAETD